jgi:multiple sugar transport system ATP-binding protein
MVFQNCALPPHGVCRWPWPELRKYPKEEIDAGCWAADILGIQEFAGRKPKALSAASGSGWRWAGRAQTKVYIDERQPDAPSCGCRCAPRSQLHSRLGATMIYVTHDQTEP